MRGRSMCLTVAVQLAQAVDFTRVEDGGRFAQFRRKCHGVQRNAEPRRRGREPRQVPLQVGASVLARRAQCLSRLELMRQAREELRLQAALPPLSRRIAVGDDAAADAHAPMAHVAGRRLEHQRPDRHRQAEVA